MNATTSNPNEITDEHGRVVSDTEAEYLKHIGSAIDDCVHQFPWQAVGAAVAVGIVVGLLIGGNSEE
ncbi:MAG: hypothetical protein AB1813_24975 [Verrucomicrobiota bacterium]|jgi:ElaB/YqjD/DUF883 family membrane-anchored ribosome-binding protein